jgi:hypothetical protein
MRSSIFVASVALLSLSCSGRESREEPPSSHAVTQTSGRERGTAVATTQASEHDAAASAEGPRETDAALAAQGASDAGVAPRPLYYDREITEEDLRGRSLRELALLRNTPYARRGHTFRRPWLNDYFRSQAWYRPQRVVQESELSELDRRNARFVGQFDTSLPRATLEQMAQALVERDQRNALRDEDAVESVLLSQRLGRHIALSRASASDTSPLADPSRLDTLVSREELLALSPRDIWFLRNTIYARRGRPFRTSLLREYFASMEWYRPDPAYNDARLRRVDRQNLRLIQSIEAEFGGPTNASNEAEREQSALGA